MAKDHDKETPHPPPKTEGKRPTLTVDYERYAELLEGSDLTDEQKLELLQSLWHITVEFVSLGFGVHPIQQAQADCGKHHESAIDQRDSSSNAIELKQSILGQFIKATDLERDGQLEGVEQ